MCICIGVYISVFAVIIKSLNFHNFPSQHDTISRKRALRSVIHLIFHRDLSMNLILLLLLLFINYFVISFGEFQLTSGRETQRSSPVKLINF